MEPEGSSPHSQVPATCPYPEPARSSPYPLHPTSWRSILILSSHLRLGLPNGLFPITFPHQTLYTPLLSPIRATCPAHLILFDFITRTVSGDQYRSPTSSLCNFLHSPVTLSLLGPNILRSTLSQTPPNPQPTFHPQSKRPSFTPIQNKRQNYSSVYLNL